MPTENVLIEDCIVYHGHGGVTIGSEMSSGVRNVRVNNCVFMGTDIGLRFKSQRGRGGVVEKIYISNVRMTDIATDAIGFNLYYGGQAPGEGGEGAAAAGSRSRAVSEKTPQFRDIYIENVVCRGARQAVALQGLPEMPIRGIHLQRFHHRRTRRGLHRRAGHHVRERGDPEQPGPVLESGRQPRRSGRSARFRTGNGGGRADSGHQQRRHLVRNTN